MGSVKQTIGESVCDYTARFLQSAAGTNMPDRWLVGNFVDCSHNFVKPQDLASFDCARKAALCAEQAENETTEVSVVATTDWRLDTLIELLTN